MAITLTYEIPDWIYEGDDATKYEPVTGAVTNRAPKQIQQNVKDVRNVLQDSQNIILTDLIQQNLKIELLKKLLGVDLLDGKDSAAFAKNDLSNVDDSAVLNKVKNIDGSGSGLDADLLRGLPADFTANLSDNGYQKLPNGLIIQWGKVQIENSSNDATSIVFANVTFPLSFPNTLLNVFISSQENGYKEAIEHALTVVSASSSAAELKAERWVGANGGSETFYLNWLAIGY